MVFEILASTVLEILAATGSEILAANGFETLVAVGFESLAATLVWGGLECELRCSWGWGLRHSFGSRNLPLLGRFGRRRGSDELCISFRVLVLRLLKNWVVSDGTVVYLRTYYPQCISHRVVDTLHR